MLKQHKNKVFETIRNSHMITIDQIDDELKTETFTFTYINNGWGPTMEIRNKEYDCFIIKIKNSPLQFWICHDTEHPFDSYIYRYSLFRPGYTLYTPNQKWQEIDEICNQLTNWLEDTVSRYKEELNTPDLWEQFEQYQPFISSSTFSKEDFQPFSPQEKEEINSSLDVFKELVDKNFNPNDEQEKFNNDRIEYLRKKLDELNKFDWRGLAISIVVGIGINLSVDTHSGKLLLDLLRQAFNTVQYLLK
jgi:hypothetical protein